MKQDHVFTIDNVMRSAFSVVALAGAVSCGSSSPSGNTADAGAQGTGGGSSASRSSGSGSNASGAGGSTSGSSSVVVDAGAPVGDAGCSSMGSATACQACCSATNQAAGLRFFGAALACACAPSYCGPVTGDAGAADASPNDGGDAGTVAFGQSACTADMCSGQAAPSSACTQCVTMTLQTPTGTGPCVATASLTCLTDSTCSPIVTCALGCPQ